ESTAGLARLDHVAVQPVERLGMLGERLGERLPALDVLDHVAQRVLEHPRLALALEDLQAAEDRQAGVLQGRELAGEGAKMLGRDLADRERLLLPPPATLLGGRLAGLLRLLADLGDEEPLLPDELLSLFLGRGVNRVLDLATRVVHRFILIDRHSRPPAVVSCQLSVVSCQKIDGRWQMADGRWRMADGGWQMANGRWQMADGRWQTPPRFSLAAPPVFTDN